MPKTLTNDYLWMRKNVVKLGYGGNCRSMKKHSGASAIWLTDCVLAAKSQAAFQNRYTVSQKWGANRSGSTSPPLKVKEFKPIPAPSEIRQEVWPRKWLHTGCLVQGIVTACPPHIRMLNSANSCLVSQVLKHWPTDDFHAEGASCASFPFMNNVWFLGWI